MIAKRKEAEKPKRKPRRKGLKADYKGATPKQVAEIVLRYKPTRQP